MPECATLTGCSTRRECCRRAWTRRLVSVKPLAGERVAQFVTERDEEQHPGRAYLGAIVSARQPLN
jgi:hypothetical protein